MNAILVCVDYHDLLSITLPYNRHHFKDVVVVTSLKDTKTVDIAWANNCRVHRTNAFYEGGAIFNKFKAMEEGLDVLGRKGWLCIMDADILWPRSVTNPDNLDNIYRYLRIGYLYTPRRYMLEDTSILQRGVPPEEQWGCYPLHRQEKEWAGYSQIFHADDPHLGQVPWHETDWIHCGGADSFFQAKWSIEYKIRPSFRVLHLGPAGTNWCGRATPYIDGTIPDEAREKQLKVRELISKRGSVQGNRFYHERLH